MMAWVGPQKAGMHPHLHDSTEAHYYKPQSEATMTIFAGLTRSLVL